MIFVSVLFFLFYFSPLFFRYFCCLDFIFHSLIRSFVEILTLCRGIFTYSSRPCVAISFIPIIEHERAMITNSICVLCFSMFAIAAAVASAAAATAATAVVI